MKYCATSAQGKNSFVMEEGKVAIRGRYMAKVASRQKVVIKVALNDRLLLLPLVNALRELPIS